MEANMQAATINLFFYAPEARLKDE